MKNPAEETTVRPNQNQTTRDWTGRVQVTNQLPMKKNCNLPRTASPLSRGKHPAKGGNRLSLFWQPICKNCHGKSGSGEMIRGIRLGPARKLPAFHLVFLAYLLHE